MQLDPVLKWSTSSSRTARRNHWRRPRWPVLRRTHSTSPKDAYWWTWMTRPCYIVVRVPTSSNKSSTRWTSPNMSILELATTSLRVPTFHLLSCLNNTTRKVQYTAAAAYVSDPHVVLFRAHLAVTSETVLFLTIIMWNVSMLSSFEGNLMVCRQWSRWKIVGGGIITYVLDSLLVILNHRGRVSTLSNKLQVCERRSIVFYVTLKTLKDVAKGVDTAFLPRLCAKF